MLAIVLAAHIAAPQPVKFLSWWSPDDMPASVQSAGKTRFVGARVTVRNDGSIKDCDVEGRSEDKRLDAVTCAIILRRGKFDPARSQDGSLSYGVFRRVIVWAIGAPPSPDYLPTDLELTVDRLPSDVRSPALIYIVAAVDAEGKPTACAFDPPNSGHVVPNATLLNLACATVMKQWVSKPAFDDQLKPVPSVQNVTVRFRLQK